MQTRYVYIAVALFKSPTAEFGPKDLAVVVAVEYCFDKIVRLARALKSEDSLSFNPGGYVTVYKTIPGTSLIDLKLHRIGDDLESFSSPIVFSMHRTSEGWVERQFLSDFEIASQVNILRRIG